MDDVARVEIRDRLKPAPRRDIRARRTPTTIRSQVPSRRAIRPERGERRDTHGEIDVLLHEIDDDA